MYKIFCETILSTFLMRSRMCLMQDLAILLRSHKLSIIVIVFCFDVKMISTIFYCRAEQKYLESMKKILIVFDFFVILDYFIINVPVLEQFYICFLMIFFRAD